jgi:hypothetical protein
VAAIWLQRTVGGVAPFDHADLPDGWKVGDALMAHITKPRNGKLHRKAFVLLDKVWPHTEYKTKEMLRKAMTIGAEFVDEIIHPITGQVTFSARSWEFSSMDDFEFQELYSRLIDVALVIVPKSTRDDWETAVDEIVRM